MRVGLEIASIRKEMLKASFIPAQRTKSRQRSKKEIRVAWEIAGHIGAKVRKVQGGYWFPDTPKNRQILETAVETGNAAYRTGSHWIEERET